MRFRNGGQFADAVAAVRSGRRAPRPNSAPTIKASPAAIPGAKRSEPEPRPAPPAPRPRPNPSHRTPPPARRAFSAGQRALLWAAGVLGTLAIISAVLIVMADREKRSNTPVEETFTETVTPEAAEVPVAPAGWTGGVENSVAGGARVERIRFGAAVPVNARPSVGEVPR
jgi:serine/threonine-protein kinase